MKSFFRKILNRSIKDKGIWITFLLSMVALLWFYGKILQHPNTVFFSKDGDGLQSYYTTLYHVKYDTSYSYFQGMNYPYGEHVMFTNCQPVISNTIKFISANIADVSDYTVAIVNLMMIFSLIIAALFIYLILKEFKVGQYYSAFVATGIAYLSPLIIRFCGHYSLSYIFTIPVILYGVIRFYKESSWKKSLILGLFVLLMSTFHMYNFGFSAAIIGFFWVIVILTEKKFRNWKILLRNIPLQIILPLLVINIWLWFTDNVHDRTSFPWGFFEYKSRWEGVFIQDYDISNSFLKTFVNAKTISWEGWSYVGHIATCFFIILFTVWGVIPFIASKSVGFILVLIILALVFYFIRKRRFNVFELTDNKLMNIFLWTGFVSLMVSFALPFLFFPDVLKYMGPIKQLRSIGRFAWIFYYTLNMGVFYYIFHLKIHRIIKYLIFVISISVLYYDAYRNNEPMQGYMNNSFIEISDVNNTSPDNKWVLTFDKSRYQSIIPLPFFHVGSENIGLEPEGKNVFNTFWVSLKTGLPTNAVLLSRTSISQSLKNISLVLEPYKKPELANDLFSDKPFLLVVDTGSDLSTVEKMLLAKATFITSLRTAELYELPFNSLIHLSDSLFEKTEKEISDNNKMYIINGFLLKDSIDSFIYNGFDESVNSFSYSGNGSWTCIVNNGCPVYEGGVPFADTSKEYIMSFWVGKVNHDLILRTILIFGYCNSAGSSYYNIYNNLNRYVKIIDGQWALAEFPFRIKHKKDKIRISFWNRDTGLKDTLFVDDLLIRPDSENIYKIINKTTVYKNNRYYFRPN